MNATINPRHLSGVIYAPASKSSTQRALALALLRRGTTTLVNPGDSNDDRAAIEIIRSLGAEVSIEEQRIIVKSAGFPATKIKNGVQLDSGESGLGIRMFTPIAALSANEIEITGEGSLRNRPIDFFDEALPKIGVEVSTSNGKLPVKVKGPLKPADITIDGSLSSQYLTGLLVSYSAYLTYTTDQTEPITITVRNLKSRPYIDLTLDVLQRFGFAVPENLDYRQFIFHPPMTDVIPQGDELEYTIEGDWSGGAFLLVGGAIAGPITVRGLDLLSTQADRAIVDVLISANAAIAIEAKGIVVHPGQLRAFHFDATDCPDLFPPIVALAAYCEGESVIKGATRLTHKESNRALTLQQEFGKMGVVIELHGDEMVIRGGRVSGANVDSCHDHRIAMSCAIAALAADGSTTIAEAEAVKKSYPNFFEDLAKLGADVSLDNKFNWHE